ncbi:MAG: hypothetical protein ABQ298_12255 [Puniceicoccaceae bacterium]
MGVLAAVGFALCMGGVMLFREPLLERHIEYKTGYRCDIGKVVMDPRRSMLELRDMTIWNKAPYPEGPLAQVRRLRAEWHPGASRHFPKRLRLLELELDSLTVIRRSGNHFNVLEFVEALVDAWGSPPERHQPEDPEHALHIEEVWVLWDQLIAVEAESSEGKRMEVLLEYEASHSDVTRIHEVSDPAIQVARKHVDRFYMFSYLMDALRNLFR